MVAVSGNSRRPPGGSGPTLLLTIIFSRVGELASQVSPLQLLTTLRAGISRLFGTRAATESVSDVPVPSGHPTEEVECVQVNNGKKLNTSNGADSSGIDYLNGHDSITRPAEKEQGWKCKKADLFIEVPGLYCHDVHALSDQHESPPSAPVQEKRTNCSDEMVLSAPRSRSFTHLCKFVSADEVPMSSPTVTPEADSIAGANVEPSQAATIPAADAAAKRIGKEASSLPNSVAEVLPSNSPLPTKEGSARPFSSPLPTKEGSARPFSSPMPTKEGSARPFISPMPTKEGSARPFSSPMPTKEGSARPFSSPMPTKEGSAHPSSRPLPTKRDPPHSAISLLDTGGGPSPASSGPVDTEEMTTGNHLTPLGKDGESKHQNSKEMKANLVPSTRPSDSGGGTVCTPLN